MSPSPRLAWVLVLVGCAACGDNSPTTAHDGPPGPACVAGAATQEAGSSVLELHGSPTRAGAYVEPAFSQAAAATLCLETDFTAKYTGSAFAQPVFYDAGDPGGAGDLVIAATEDNVVSAFDLTGSAVWQVTLGTPQTMPNPSEGANCGDINPLGITGTPVIDPATRTLYLDAMIHDGGARHRVYALSLDDGSTLPSWPVDVGSAVTSPIPFLPATENQRGGLTFLNHQLYVPYGGHAGDCGDYHGWLVAIPDSDPQHPSAFATTVGEAGAWMPGGVTSDGTNVFAVFGNGTPTATWGNSNMVARFGSGAAFSGSATDFWVPENWMTLDNIDLDITGPAMPLDLPGSTPEHLLVSFGKDGGVVLTDRDNLGGIGPPVAQLGVSTSVIINTSTLYTTAQGTYVAFRGTGNACPDGDGSHDLVSVKITPGSPPSMSLAWCAGTGKTGSPIETSVDGTTQGIVWAIGAEDDQRLHGYDADTGAVVFAGGGAGDAMTATSRFITPIVAKGRMYVAADGQLYAFTVP